MVMNRLYTSGLLCLLTLSVAQIQAAATVTAQEFAQQAARQVDKPYLNKYSKML